MTRSQRVSNRRFREASGWAPRRPSAREGWPEVVAVIERSPAASPAVRRRVVLGLSVLAPLVVLALARGGDQQRRSVPQTADSRAGSPSGGEDARPAVGGAAAGA
jgi:hypothetical protein